jgi:hypothetical protein
MHALLDGFQSLVSLVLGESVEKRQGCSSLSCMNVVYLWLMRFLLTNLAALVTALLAARLPAQAPGTGPIVSPRCARTEVFTVAPWRGSGIPAGWRAPVPAPRLLRNVPEGVRVCDSLLYAYDPDSEVQDGLPGISTPGKQAATQAAMVQRSFVANESGPFNPMDNTMAISDLGFIVSADNYTIDFYTDGPDTLRQFQLHADFYGDTAIGNRGFDPKITYDRWAHRFILVMLLDQDFRDNKMIISFSKTEDPRLGWNHYYLNTDTLDQDQYFDFPLIAINARELFISGNMVNDAAKYPTGSKLYQVNLREGYDSLPLRCRIWTDLRDDDGDLAAFVCPLGHGLQDSAYQRGVYLASTKTLWTLPTPTSTDLFWYFLDDSLGAANPSIQTHQLQTTAYAQPASGLQLNGVDSIQTGDCRVLSGYFLRGKLNFVYVKSTNGFATIVLNRLDVTTNTNLRVPWGFSSAQLHYCYPSIAFYGQDEQDEDNLIVCFQRTGASIYPQLLMVQFDDSVFAANSVVVKQGIGFIAMNGTGATERWGDYTGIQRRYGASYPACWLVGSYPAGPDSNYFGRPNALNAFVAEISDTLVGNSSSEPLQLKSILIQFYPTPSIDGLVNYKANGKMGIEEILVFGSNGQGLGKLTNHSKWNGQLDLTQYAAGTYYITFKMKGGQSETKKLIRF